MKQGWKGEEKGNTSLPYPCKRRKLQLKTFSTNEIVVKVFTNSAQMIDVLIIHYNTPELTAATINSLWKHTPNARVTVFDNSDERPFSPIGLDRLNKPNRENGLFTLVDNTRGQIVDWDQWLTQFPNKMPCPENNRGSA